MEKKKNPIASTLFFGLLASLIGKLIINLDYLEGVKKT